MSKKDKKYELKEGRGSLWKVAKDDRRHKDIRYNGQAKLDGEVRWITLFKNYGKGKAPKFNLSVGDVVQPR